MTKFDNRFGEGLGISLAACVRDLIRFTGSEAARATNAPTPFFNFINPGATRNFNSLWSALLEALAILACMNEIEGFREDDKTVKKTLFNLQQFVQRALAPRLMSRLTPEQHAHYDAARKALMREAMSEDTIKADLSEQFLRLLHGDKYDKKASDRIRVMTLNQIELSYDTLRRVASFEVKHAQAQAAARAETTAAKSEETKK